MAHSGRALWFGTVMFALAARQAAANRSSTMSVSATVTNNCTIAANATTPTVASAGVATFDLGAGGARLHLVCTRGTVAPTTAFVVRPRVEAGIDRGAQTVVVTVNF